MTRNHFGKSMRRLLIVAQKNDEQDDLLGFFVAWIREFQKHYEVEVIALHEKKARSRIMRWLVFCVRVLRATRRNDAVFCHMSPMFAVIAALGGRPVYLWYLHRSVTWKLKLAEMLSRNIFTASAESLRLKSKKIIAVGHGIDVDRFMTQRTWKSADRILSVGRISPIKDFETLLKAAPQATIVGRPIMPGDKAYLKKLQTLGGHFVGFVPYIEMSRYYANADIFVNCAPTGGLDKAVLEAMASGCIVLVCNQAFKNDLPSELFFASGDPESLATAIRRLQSKSIGDLQALSKDLVRQVHTSHNLSRTIEAMVNRIDF